VVRNRVRNDRTGRILLTIPVPRAADPDRVAEILRTCALAHREVMSEPAPKVFFKRMTDAVMEFDLVCFVDDIEVSGRVSSDLLFAIHRALREIGIGQPAPDATAQMLQGLGRVETSIEHIARAIEAREALKAPAEPIPLPAKKKG
jgi:potassium-dependent mechanosensitive channel